MDQRKTGKFLKELRKEKNLTQEQLAEMLGVSNRSVSRWENGVNMPDFDLVIEIVNYFDVTIEEFLDGERKMEMDKKTEETLLKVADYENNEKMKFSRRLCRIFIAALIAFIVYMVIDIQGLSSTGVYENIADFSLGLVFGVLILGTLFTSRYMGRIQAFKRRILHRKGAE
ncbi:MAG: helix-turn-helix transcriptional regulator [Coprococcus sp.]|nr:helix-turn-helix transcriptional regulator [Coprococcus sp.]